MMKATLLAFFAALPVVAADVKTVTVSAGDYDRRNTVVTFRGEFPRGRDLELSTKGKTFSLQVNEDGTASFVLDELGKGKELTLRAGTAVRAVTRLEAKRDKTKVKLGRGSETWLEYQAEPSDLPRENVKAVFQRGAYLHP